MEGLPANRGAGVVQRRLCCIACGLVAKGKAFGWRAYRAEGRTIAVYCPGCSEHGLDGGDDDFLLPFRDYDDS